MMGGLGQQHRLTPGSLWSDFIVSRRFGVDEALDDQTVIRAVTRMFVQDPVTSSVLLRKQQKAINAPLVTVQSTFPVETPSISASFSGVQSGLPVNVHLLTLELQSVPSDDVDVSVTLPPYILRLQHVFEVDEHPQFSQPVAVNLTQVLPPQLLGGPMIETTLTGNQVLSAMLANRLQWNTVDLSHPFTQLDTPVDPANITLSPRQIRTFLVNGQP
jgi:hypothetical protein